MSSEWAEHVGRAWRESAPFWAKNSDLVREMFEPITSPLLEAAGIARADRVLDVAGGPGEPTLTIAGVVGLAGRVVHTDLAWDMSTAVRGEAADRGLDTLRFVLASGDSLPFEDGTFDRVVCRLGLMFLPDVERGVAEMLRVTRSGGSVALAVWGTKERNPYFAIPADVASRYSPSPDPPGAPDVWRFGDDGYVASMLERAGAETVAERRIDFDIAAPLDFDRWWTVRVELSDSLRARVAALDEPARRALASDVRSATTPYFTHDAMRFPAEAVVASGTAAS